MMQGWEGVSCTNLSGIGMMAGAPSSIIIYPTPGRTFWMQFTAWAPCTVTMRVTP